MSTAHGPWWMLIICCILCHSLEVTCCSANIHNLPGTCQADAASQLLQPTSIAEVYPWILQPTSIHSRLTAAVLCSAAYTQERATVLAGRSRSELFSSTATEVLGCSWEIDSSTVHVCYLPAPIEPSEMLHYGLQAIYQGRASETPPGQPMRT